MRQRRVLQPNRWGSEPRRDVAAEFNPLFYQLNYIFTSPEEKWGATLTVLRQVEIHRLSKTEARQILLALGLA